MKGLDDVLDEYYARVLLHHVCSPSSPAIGTARKSHNCPDVDKSLVQRAIYQIAGPLPHLLPMAAGSCQHCATCKVLKCFLEGLENVLSLRESVDSFMWRGWTVLLAYAQDWKGYKQDLVFV